MPNFFTDNSDIFFQFDRIDFESIVAKKEQNFIFSEKYPEAPKNLEDAVDNYRRVLEVAGAICGDYVAPRAAAVDKEGATCEDGVVTYAQGTSDALDALTKAGMMGIMIPWEYDGLNFPQIVATVFVEMISQGDASLMNIVGLQDIGMTISKFGDEECKQRYLPRFASGEVTGAMALTEPDAGSDLQAVQLRATEDPENGCWRLNGVKRFITNGCGHVMLVLARTETETKGGRGLSMLAYETDETVRIRRIEDKLGIHGSPTCELQFNNSPAYLVGERRMGLVKYVMSLMNSARLGVSCQALGIAQAAYNEALKYANERKQFGKEIIKFPAVYEMLADMQVAIETARSLVYETSVVVDTLDLIVEQEERPEELDADAKKKLRQDKKYYTRLASVLTPMSKYLCSEMGNKVADDAIQIHGGTGYMREFNVERHYRDARITNIYEGTTQFQVIAAIGGVLTGSLNGELDKLANQAFPEEFDHLVNHLVDARKTLDKIVEYVKEKKDTTFQEFHARRIVDIAMFTYIGYMALTEAMASEHKRFVAEHYIHHIIPQIEANAAYILDDEEEILENHLRILGVEVAE